MKPRIDTHRGHIPGVGTWGDSLWGELRQQAPHDADFGGLGRDDIVGEDIGIHFLAGAGDLKRSSTILSAPAWCLIMPLRKSRSKATPFASSAP